MTAFYQAEPAEVTDNALGAPAREVYVLPSSVAQQRFWLLDQLEPGNTSLNMPLALRLAGELDVTNLERAINQMIARHEILRTTFAVEDETVVQVITPELTSSLEVVAVTGSEQEEREDRSSRLMLDEAHLTFDLVRGPLFRAKLLRLETTDHILLLTMHHIICDGWSNGVLVREIGEIYDAFSKGLPSRLPELPIQYGDFAVWQRDWLESEGFQEQLDYWQGQLGGELPTLNMPTDYPRNRNRTSEGAMESLLLSHPLTRALKVLARREDVTQFMIFLAAFKVLLHRYTGDEHILVGSPTANRIQSESEGLIGAFANTLMLKTELSGDPSFGELLQRIKKVSLGAFSNQTLPFEKLAEVVRPSQARASSQLFQVLFIFQTAFMQPVKLDGLSITPMRSVSPGSIFELSLGVVERAEGTRLQMEYNTNLFEAETIKLMLGHLQSILQAIATDPRQPIGQIPLLTAAERQALPVDWNQTDEACHPERPVAERFDERANLAPERIALLGAGQSSSNISYGELKRKSDEIADYLKGRRLNKGARVGVHLESLSEFAAELLGVLKAGFVAVPLNHRMEGVEFCDAVLNPDERPNFTGPNVKPGQESAPTRYAQFEEDAAIVFGENGVAALISHGAMVARSEALVLQIRIAPDDTVLLPNNWSGSSTLETVVATLLAGARLVSVSNGATAREILAVVRDQQVTTLCLSQHLFHRIASESMALPEGSRVLVAGGNRISRATIRKFKNPNARLLISYGNAETGDVAALIEASTGDSTLRIRKPSPTVRMYVLDRNLQPVPAGVRGTLYIACGNTASTHVSGSKTEGSRSVFLNATGERAFSTGNTARYLRTGDIELLNDSAAIGRTLDTTIVEELLLDHRAVTEAKVVLGENSFVCYVVLKEDEKVDEGTLRNLFEAEVAGRGLSTAFVIVPFLPLTPDGVLDTSRLPAPGVVLTAPDDESPTDQHSDKGSPADSSIETRLKEIWIDVLGVREVGTRDDFFELGGHSLMAVKLFDQIKRVLDVNLPLQVMFRATTIEKLSAIIREETPKEKWSSLVPINPSGSYPPFFVVHAAGGNVLFYKDLASRLGSSQPLYGLQARGLDGTQQVHPSVEGMATHYIDEIKTVQQHGPYYLGGASFGGLIAYEMARVLQERGEEVALLALFDTYAPGYPKLLPGTSELSVRFWRLAQRVRHHVVTIRTLEPDERWPYIIEKTTKARNLLRRSTRNSRKIIKRRVLKSLGRRLPEALRETQNAIIVASRTYRPQPYPGVISLFRADEQPRGFYKDATLGWGDLAEGGLEIHEVPGMHGTLVVEPRVRFVVAKLQPYLQRPYKISASSAAD